MADSIVKPRRRLREKSTPIVLNRSEVLHLVYDKVITIGGIADDIEGEGESGHRTEHLLHEMRQISKLAGRAEVLIESLLDAEEGEG